MAGYRPGDSSWQARSASRLEQASDFEWLGSCRLLVLHALAFDERRSAGQSHRFPSYDIGWLALPLLDTKISTVVVAHSNTDNFYFPVRHYSDFITYAIGVSDEICNKFNKVSKMPEERIEWIPYGIKPAVSLEERITAGKLTIVFAGRMEEYQKKISDVKEIIKKIATAGIRYHFKLIGDGTMYEPIKEELAVEIGKGNVEMPGWIAGEKVLEAFQESDVFILTSSSEGFSISLIEAMANGCCPVVTDIPSGSIQLIR